MRPYLHTFIAILVVAMIADGCALTTTPVKNAGVGGATTQALLKAIDIHYFIFLANIDEHITITPEGQLRRVAVIGDTDGQTEIRQGLLTPAQLAEVARLFVGWKKLSDQPYGTVPDGPYIEVHYGDKKVSGGSETPKQVFDAIDRIRKLANAMPLMP